MTRVMRLATLLLAPALALVVAAAGCNGGVGGLRTATPAPSPDATPTAAPVVAPPGTIVATFDDFNSEIYTVAPDGGRLTRITDTPEYVELDPAWAPDGRLAFIRWRLFESKDELMVTRADGSDPVRVAGGMDISQPAWSPDGSRIAFVEGRASFYAVQDVSDCTRIDSSRNQVPPRLFVADVASGTAVPLIDLISPDGCVLPFARPQWSPDGAKIALARRGVYLVDVASGRLTEIVPPTDVATAAWSPDGRRLAVAVTPSYGGPSARILMVGADGQGLVEIARQSDWVHSLAWSPQGDLISIVAGDAYSGQGSLFVINPDGSGLRSLAQGVLEDVAWSPDGHRLAAALVDPSSSQGGVSNIYTVDVNDGSTTRLTDAPASEYEPAWSPDGSAIAFNSHRDAQSGIFAVHPDGALTPLVPRAGSQAFLDPDGRVVVPTEVLVKTATSWTGGYPLSGGTLSPDERRLATSVPTGDMVTEACSGTAGDIYVWNVDGSQVTNVTNTPDINEIGLAWSPDSLLLALTSGAPPQCHLDPTRLEIMKADGSERRLLADFGPFSRVGLPEWVSEGSALLFSVTYPARGALPGLPASEDKAELYIVNIDGSGLRRLLEFPGARIEWYLSPDRTHLAVAESPAAGGGRLLLANIDGTGLQEVTSGQGQLSLDTESSLSWSPDSSRLAFVGCDGDPCRPVAFVVNSDGSGLREIARGQGELSQFQWWPSSWSPDGTRLVFADCQGDPCQWALFAVNADGSDLRTLVDPFVPYEPPTWSPDGSELALVAHPDPCGPGEGGPHPGYLEVVNVDSGASQRLTDRCVVRGILGWPP
jgi:Tol biopolymer transport system component